jgi:hypothetical protein
MKSKNISVLFLLSILLLTLLSGCKKGPTNIESKTQGAIEIKGVRIGMTREEIRNISEEFKNLEDYCYTTIGEVEGEMNFVFDSDDKLDTMDFSFPGKDFNTVLKVITNKYPLKEIGDKKMKIFSFKDEHGTTLSMNTIVGGALILTSKSYSQKQSERSEAERAKKMNDL